MSKPSPTPTLPTLLRLTASERMRVEPPPPFRSWSYGALLAWLQLQGVSLHQSLAIEYEEHTGDVVIEVSEGAPFPQGDAVAQPYFLTDEAG